MNGTFEFVDNVNAKRIGKQKLVTKAVVVGGRRVDAPVESLCRPGRRYLRFDQPHGGLEQFIAAFAHPGQRRLHRDVGARRR